jgi:hypothetical protein
MGLLAFGVALLFWLKNCSPSASLDLKTYSLGMRLARSPATAPFRN